MFYWLYLKLRRVKLATCEAGRCWCRGARDCYFARCCNCDACVDHVGNALEGGHKGEWGFCPDCGAQFKDM